MRRASIALLSAAMLFCTLPALAEEQGYQVRVDRTMDFFFVIHEPMTFVASTLLCSDLGILWCERAENGGHFVDSVLWVYDADGMLVAVNDDDGASWASVLTLSLPVGQYRLRAGRFFCNASGCINPETPFPQGGWYDLAANVTLVLDPEPPTASIEPVPSVFPSPLPSEEPSPEVSYEPSPTEQPTVEPSPTEEPTPTPEPTPEPSPSVEPTFTPSSQPSPSPIVTIEPSPPPSVEPSETPNPTPTPQTPSEEPSVAPTPTAEPSPLESPTPSPLVDLGAAAESVGEAVAAVGAAIADAADFVANLGHDLTPTEKKRAASTIIPAVIITQVAQAAVAAASAASLGGSRKDKQ